MGRCGFDIRYIYSTFPIVSAQETAKWGSYRSRDLCLAWINALIAGQPDAEVAGLVKRRRWTSPIARTIFYQLDLASASQGMIGTANSMEFEME